MSVTVAATDGSQPVSYTHLDVYKRQAHTLDYRELLPVLTVFLGTGIRSGELAGLTWNDIAVSYTHLDVYKRQL